MLKTLVFFLLICFQCVRHDTGDYHPVHYTSMRVESSENKKGILI